MQYRQICFLVSVFLVCVRLRRLAVDSFFKHWQFTSKRNTSGDIVCLLFDRNLFQRLHFETWKLSVLTGVVIQQVADVKSQNTFWCRLCLTTRWQH